MELLVTHRSSNTTWISTMNTIRTRAESLGKMVLGVVLDYSTSHIMELNTTWSKELLINDFCMFFCFPSTTTATVVQKPCWWKVEY